MDPVVVSETIQEFNGERFYLCGAYFQRNGRRLHRLVWELAYGKRPPGGYEVHHRDENRHNNALSNLELLPKFTHRSIHAKEKAASGQWVSALERARPKAAEWHRSEEGRAWHREHAKGSIAKPREPRKFSCVQCGKEFMGFAARASKYCSRTCATMHRRKSGVDDVSRQCASCGGTFSANRYGKVKFCTVRCAADARKRKG